MSITIRRILFIVFLLAFFTITPIIMLYAAGYKINLNGWQLQKTGIFIFDSKPRGAKIFINNKAQQAFLSKLFLNKTDFLTTPAKIKNLLPGEYDVKIELSGYWSWQKKLKIDPGASTYAENIYLFRKDLPTILILGNINDFRLSPNKSEISAIRDNEVVLFNLSTNEETGLPIATSTSHNISWSDDGNRLTIDNTVYETANLNNKIDLAKTLNDKIINLKWLNNKLYFQGKNGIYNFDISLNQAANISSIKPADDYLIKNDYLYLITSTNKTTQLNIINLANGQSLRTINLPNDTSYKFINYQHNLLNIYSADRKTLFLIDPLAVYYTPLAATISNLKISSWLTENRLLYANDFEIYFFDLNSGEKTLITRISNAINSLYLHPSGNYLVFSTDQSINTIELDQREKRNITELAKFDKIVDLTMNQNGNILYFYAKIGNQEGIYKLEIQ